MSEPAGPTGILTLKQVGDVTYEQYGRILLNATGRTQINISAEDYRDLFERQNLDRSLVWYGEFQSRIQGVPNPNQSSFYNNQQACWGGGGGGAWSTQGETAMVLTTQATLSGGVNFSYNSGGAPWGALATNESGAIFAATSHVSFNPKFYVRWAQTGAGGGGQAAIGWIRRGNTFTNTNTQGCIAFRWLPNGEIFAVCAKRNGFSTDETTIGTGVNAQNGIYHMGRAEVTGGGTAVEFFFDQVSIGTVTDTTYIPNEGGTFMLSPGFGQSNAGDATMIVDYMALSQQRDPA